MPEKEKPTPEEVEEALEWAASAAKTPEHYDDCLGRALCSLAAEVRRLRRPSPSDALEAKAVEAVVDAAMAWGTEYSGLHHNSVVQANLRRNLSLAVAALAALRQPQPAQEE